jgi:hypothetical protein
MNDYLLRAQTQSEMDDALIAAGVAHEVTDGDGEVLVLPVDGINIDRIGPIPAYYRHVADTRYHVNLRVVIAITDRQVDELPTFTPIPITPYRVFA